MHLITTVAIEKAIFSLLYSFIQVRISLKLYLILSHYYLKPNEKEGCYKFESCVSICDIVVSKRMDRFQWIFLSYTSLDAL